jgi:hypothetical protein
MFCKVTLIDIRPLDIEVEGLSYINADIRSGLPAHAAAFDSASSLHCIEHFGLGRYNDPLNLTAMKLVYLIHLNSYQIVEIYMSVFLLAKRLLNLTHKGLLIHYGLKEYLRILS